MINHHIFTWIFFSFFIFIHSDFEISGDVALKVFVDVGITFEETFAITIKHINIIKNIFTGNLIFYNFTP